MAQIPGITVRHSRTCASRKTGARCNCSPAYEAWVWSNRDGKKIRSTFTGKGALSAAKNWRSDSTRAVRLKKMRAPTRKTVQQAVDEFLEGAEKGEIRNRRKMAYKPSVVRQYRSALKGRFLPEFGEWRLSDVEQTDLLKFKEELMGKAIADSTIRNVFVPVQAVFRRAKKMGDIAINPAEDLELPTGETQQRQAITPAEALVLIKALPEKEQALWACAFFTGLRRGELRALQAQDVHDGYIEVLRGWDDKAGAQGPKSEAGVRRVPMTDALKTFLDPYLERTTSTRTGSLSNAKRKGEDLLFGRTWREPFTPHHIADTADEAWKTAKLERVTLQEARHSYRTWLDHAGISETRADRYTGHAVGGVRGRYTHLLEAQLAEDAKRLDEYLSGVAEGKVIALEARAPGTTLSGAREAQTGA
ncbi:MAG TPA: tyrosine-type recombinase/integrase [Gaiellaceae bacterium]